MTIAKQRAQIEKLEQELEAVRGTQRGVAVPVADQQTKQNDSGAMDVDRPADQSNHAHRSPQDGGEGAWL